MKTEKLNSSKLCLISSMLIFGTIGIFVKYINLSSDIIAFVRGITGALFLFIVSLIRKKRIDFSLIKQKPVLLLLSGAFIGINWILLFESYRYTSVATATLCYYLAPVFIILVSPIFLGERLTVKKLICVAVALLGMVFVSGAIESGIPALSELKGILLGTGAAAFYAAVIILNKKLSDIPAFERTFFQLITAAVVLIPYSVLTQSYNKLNPDPKALILLLTVGIIHTGLAYVMYFGSIKGLKAQTVAIFSYTDPLTAIILSAVIFPDERLTAYGIMGAVMILGATLISETGFKKSST